MSRTDRIVRLNEPSGLNSGLIRGSSESGCLINDPQGQEGGGIYHSCGASMFQQREGIIMMSMVMMMNESRALLAVRARVGSSGSAPSPTHLYTEEETRQASWWAICGMNEKAFFSTVIVCHLTPSRIWAFDRRKISGRLFCSRD